MNKNKWVLSLLQKIFHWTRIPKAPLQPEELMILEEAFKTCENCPIGIIFKALIGHIRWQEHHLKNAKENYDK